MSYPKIIAVDFDGTLSLSKFPEVGTPNKPIVEYIKAQKKNGAEIILNTMREGEILDRAVEWCRSIGIGFDAVNDNLPRMKEFFSNNPRKVFANEYIDDCNISFRDIPERRLLNKGCWKCGVCGNEIYDDENYCPECGTKIKK